MARSELGEFPRASRGNSYLTQQAFLPTTERVKDLRREEVSGFDSGAVCAQAPRYKSEVNFALAAKATRHHGHHWSLQTWRERQA